LIPGYLDKKIYKNISEKNEEDNKNKIKVSNK